MSIKDKVVEIKNLLPGENAFAMLNKSINYATILKSNVLRINKLLEDIKAQVDGTGPVIEEASTFPEYVSTAGLFEDGEPRLFRRVNHIKQGDKCEYYCEKETLWIAAEFVMGMLVVSRDDSDEYYAPDVEVELLPTPFEEPY